MGLLYKWLPERHFIQVINVVLCVAIPYLTGFIIILQAFDTDEASH